MTVRYFAILRERRGLETEAVQTKARSPIELYAELSGTHGLGLPATMVKCAVNGAFVESDHLLNDGDEVVFIPPVAGG